MTCPHCGQQRSTRDSMLPHVVTHETIRQGMRAGLGLCATCWHLRDGVGCKCRYWCTLAPCCPCEPLVVDGRSIHAPEAGGGVSFPSVDAYHRHLMGGHFLMPDAPGVPLAHVAPRRRDTWEKGVPM